MSEGTQHSMIIETIVEGFCFEFIFIKMCDTFLVFERNAWDINIWVQSAQKMKTLAENIRDHYLFSDTHKDLGASFC